MKPSLLLEYRSYKISSCQFKFLKRDIAYFMVEMKITLVLLSSYMFINMIHLELWTHLCSTSDREHNAGFKCFDLVGWYVLTLSGISNKPSIRSNQQKGVLVQILLRKPHSLTCSISAGISETKVCWLFDILFNHWRFSQVCFFWHTSVSCVWSLGMVEFICYLY